MGNVQKCFCCFVRFGGSLILLLLPPTDTIRVAATAAPAAALSAESSALR